MRQTLSRAEARRLSLRAQGLGARRPEQVTGRQLRREIQRMATLQIDSVNVFARSHYLPLLSRLGPYDVALLDRLLFARRGPFVEFWAHQASFIAAEDWPLFGFRRRQHLERHATTDWFRVDDATLDWVRGELSSRGPLRPADIEDDARRTPRGPWWDWSSVKRALEFLWFTGEVAIAGRRGFQRVYGLVEQVLPAAVLGREVPGDEAIRELVLRAARACGVATLSDLDDYWRLRNRPAVARAVAELVEAGELLPVRVEGWATGARPAPAWVHRAAVLPRAMEAAALLTPFDPVVWFRERSQRLFDFTYRIEIYTPAPRRRYGYYSLPVLVGDRIVGRVDLKADRAASVLLVQSAWWEPNPPAGAAERIAVLLREAAAWQGLETISVSRWGDATDDLAALLRAPRHQPPDHQPPDHQPRSTAASRPARG